MRRIFAASGTALTIMIAASGAVAQERAGDAALGAVSGAVVLGPVGAVAGAVVGYTAGPSISHAWRHRRQQRYTPPGSVKVSARSSRAPAKAAAAPPAAAAPHGAASPSHMAPVQSFE